MKILRNMKGANTETKVIYKNVTKIDVVCKKKCCKKNKKRPKSSCILFPGLILFRVQNIGALNP